MHSQTLNLLNYAITWLSQNQDLQDCFRQVQKENPAAQHFIITSDYIYSIYKEFIDQTFAQAHLLQIPDGESAKTMQTIEKLCKNMLAKNADRKSIIWAFGGGVIGDIAGFTAAVFMRGVSFIQVPTTLLAMVDSSVGGKTGVNTVTGKNIIGCFYQPKQVVISVSFLNTLAHREILCGLAETLKAALLMDQELFLFLEKNIANIRTKDLPTMQHLSFAAVQVKAKVVEQDEKEKGLRAILNLGHTLAHALESAASYQGIHHGEAVAIGLHFAMRVSVAEGFLAQEKATRVIKLMQALELPLLPEQTPAFASDPKAIYPSNKLTPESLIAFMQKDKKNTNGEIYFVLIKAIGSFLLPLALPQEKLFLYTKDFLNAQHNHTERA